MWQQRVVAFKLFKYTILLQKRIYRRAQHGGWTHILRQTGMCHSNWLLFARNPETWVRFLLFSFFFKSLKPSTWVKFSDWAQIICENWAYFSRKPPGVTHIFGRTGMCRSNGSLFYKKSLNMGPVFYQKILKHGSTFLTEPKFSGFRMAKTPKIVKFLKNGPIFQEKSLKMGTLFCQNHP